MTVDDLPDLDPPPLGDVRDPSRPLGRGSARARDSLVGGANSLASIMLPLDEEPTRSSLTGW